MVEELLTALAPIHESFDARFSAIEEAIGLAKEQNEELTAQNAELREELTATQQEKENFAKMPAAESHRVSAPKQVSKSSGPYRGGGDLSKHGFKKVN